ncbi:hypothetical protein MB84_31355 (plasmid) [Pandoraea oxalativorans]|uniref:Uncharacterized protein n=1 Tax=Pandoraea oxalativorans TaxID=573737 RepID=A0A192B0R2_9BURK|nr:hypothetical protein MB84_31355 [Pandoraea oxalativorans]
MAADGGSWRLLAALGGSWRLLAALGGSWRGATRAICASNGLGLAGTLLRQTMLAALIHLTLKRMSDIAGHALHRVQRFSTDWHTGSFAGETVRKITRGP